MSDAPSCHLISSLSVLTVREVHALTPEQYRPHELEDNIEIFLLPALRLFQVFHFLGLLMG